MSIFKLMSNTPMNLSHDSHNVDQRLTDLEIKSAYTEDLLEQLDSVIVRQQKQIDDLIRTIIELRQPTTDGVTGAARSLRDDMPPHF